MANSGEGIALQSDRTGLSQETMPTMAPMTTPGAKAASSSGATDLIFSIAEPSDDQELRELLASYHVGRDITLSIRKEPDFFEAMKVKGRHSRTFVCRDKASGKMIAMLSKSVKPVYLNGAVTPMGYFSNFRVHKDYRGRNIAFRAMASIFDLRGETDVPFFLATVMGGGDRLLNVLNRRSSSSFLMRGLGVYHNSMILVFNRSKPFDPAFKIVRGNADNLDCIVECLKRNGARRNFYPVYDKQDFLDPDNYLKGFSYKDFYAAEADGKIVGVVGTWDQSHFSQTVITGYSRRMRYFARLYGLAARIFKLPELPKLNRTFPYVTIGFVAIDNDDPRILTSLLAAVYRDSMSSGPRYLAIAFHSDDPLRAAMKGFFSIPCESHLYALVPRDRPELLTTLADTVPYLELSAL